MRIHPINARGYRPSVAVAVVLAMAVAAAKAAIAGLNGKPMGGRNLTVNQARPKTEGGGGGGRRFGGEGGGRRW